MQQELIEMLDKMVKYFDEIPSDSYYYRETAAILDEAEKLVEKAKKSAKEHAVPQGFKPVGYLRSDEFDGHVFEPIDGTWPFDELLFSFSTSPEPVQEVTLTDEWAECKRISELPEVDEALRLFAEGETTEDQAVAIVQTIIAALREKENKL